MLFGWLVLPEWVNDILAANRYPFLFLMFGCNVAASQLIATGAFEVSFNDALVYSKLETNSLPKVERLIRLLQSASQAQ